MKRPPQTTCAVETCENAPVIFAQMHVPMNPFEIRVAGEVPFRITGPEAVDVPAGFCQRCWNFFVASGSFGIAGLKVEESRRVRPMPDQEEEDHAVG